MLSFFLGAVAALTVLQAQPASGAFIPSHTYPLRDHRGRDPSNELQFIEVDNIKMSEVGAAEYSVDVVSPLLIDNDDMVEVSFSSSAPSSEDWIGAYSPPDVDILSTVPVKYGWCSDDGNYLPSTAGRLQFNMTNLRAGIKFYYFTNGTEYPILVGEAPSIVNFNNVNEQLRPRVQPTGDVNVLNISWSSNMSSAPVLRYGLVSGNYTEEVLATTFRIERSQMCNAPANTTGWRDLGEIHTATFVGAAALANTRVYYVFGDSATDDWSKEHVLFLPPLPGTQPPSRPTTVILYDDLGRGSLDMSYTWNEYGRPSILTTMAVGAEVGAGLVDMVYHGGDISYATGYIAVWDFFLDMLSPVAGSVVYLTTVGNHESDAPNSDSYYTGNDSGGECGVVATNLIQMPAPASTNQPWWSYDVGLIHFVGMSTEHNYTIGSAQYKWLENDLASVDRSVTPWIIFGGHRAMYINSNYGEAPTSDLVVMALLIENIEPLLFKYRVNLGFYGHNHVVQRMSAVYDSEVVQAATMREDADGNVIAWHDDPQATVHMVIGTAGARFTVNYVTPYPSWCEAVFYRIGYARVSAVNSTYLNWEWVDSYDGKVYDRMVITQTNDFSEPWIINERRTGGGSSSTEELYIIFAAVGGVLVFTFVACLLFQWFKVGDKGPTASEDFGSSGSHSVSKLSPLGGERIV